MARKNSASRNDLNFYLDKGINAQRRNAEIVGSELTEPRGTLMRDRGGRTPTVRKNASKRMPT